MDHRYKPLPLQQTLTGRQVKKVKYMACQMVVSNIEKNNQGRQKVPVWRRGLYKFKEGDLRSRHEGVGDTAPLHGQVSSHQLLSFCYVLGSFAHTLSLNPHKILNYILPNFLDSPDHHHFPSLSFKPDSDYTSPNQSSRTGPCPTLKSWTGAPWHSKSLWARR